MQREFFYSARNEKGEIQRGTVRAENEREAAAQLLAQGLFVSSLRAPRQRLQGLDALLRLRRDKYTMLFCRELAVMTGAGMTVSEALALLREQEQTDAVKRLLGELLSAVDGGGTLTDAMRQRPDFFSDVVIYMVSVGEASGRLSEMLTKLAAQLEKGYTARERLLTIMIYPLILLGVTGAVLAFILRFVLPSFAGLFRELGSELPLPTRILLAVSEQSDVLALLLPFGLLAGIAVLMLLWQSAAGRRCLEGLLWRLPLVGGLIRRLELQRFAGTLAVLLSSGVVVDRALEILSEVSSALRVRQELGRVCEEVRKGWQLSRSLARLGLFPPLFLGLLRAGEETGTLDEALAHIALLAEQEADRRAQRLKILLEPAMILVLGVVVGGVVMAIALPVLESLTLFSY